MNLSVDFVNDIAAEQFAQELQTKIFEEARGGSLAMTQESCDRVVAITRALIRQYEEIGSIRDHGDPLVLMMRSDGVVITDRLRTVDEAKELWKTILWEVGLLQTDYIRLCDQLLREHPEHFPAAFKVDD